MAFGCTLQVAQDVLERQQQPATIPATCQPLLLFGATVCTGWRGTAMPCMLMPNSVHSCSCFILHQLIVLPSDCRERAWDRYVAQLLQERDNPALATARREREERDRARTSRDARC